MAEAYFAHARRALAAPLHAQIEITSCELPSSTPGQARVFGRIARVFRGPPEVLGSEVTLQVNCRRTEDDPPPAGVYLRAEALNRAAAMEVYLTRSGPTGWRIAAWHPILLDAVTEAPQHVFTAADARRPSNPGERKMIAVLIAIVLCGLAYAGWALIRGALRAWSR